MGRHVLAVVLLVAPAFAHAANADDEATLARAGLKADADALLHFFRSRTVKADRETVRKLVRDLSGRSFAVRERASAALIALGGYAVPALKEAAASEDLEVRRRADECLRAIAARSQPATVEAAARLLAKRNPDGAAAAILDFVPSLLDASSVRPLHDALARLALRDGKPEPVLVEALGDELADKRAAAAAALCRGAGAKAPLDKVRPLLRDADAAVRLHAALALLTLNEKDAVPALIDLFEKLPRNDLWAAEDALYRMAGEHAPPVALGATPATRKEFRDAWAEWWKERGDKLDLTAALKDVRRDWTLLVLLDEGEVVELDAKDRERFRIGRVAFPLDAQTLPGDRVLLAEHGGGRVVERHRDGTILWEKKVAEPLAAQRLDNGHTFIAGKNEMTEVDRDGKAVFSWSPGGEDQIMRARRLADGTFAVILHQEQKYVRLDREGRKVGGFDFPVNVQTFGGRVDVQPNGNVLIPQMYTNKVVEYDAGGKVVREFTMSQPIVATRLPNGHTLITSMNENRAIEVDLTGKQVWEYKGKTRVTRAYRR